MSEFPLPSEQALPASIVSGPDGALWFVERFAAKVGRITTAGQISEYALPGGSEPRGIAAAPLEEALWITEGTGKVARVGVDGEIRQFDVSSRYARPNQIAVGAEGDVWFTDDGADQVDRISPAGTLTHFQLKEGSKPWGITAGPDGDIWFTERFGNKIGFIATTGPTEGQINLTELRTPKSNPVAITAGPDGDVWFTEHLGNKIGRITPGGVLKIQAPAEPHEPKHGRLRIRLYCKAINSGSTCAGDLLLSPDARRRPILARGEFRLKAGAIGHARVRLNEQGARYLRRHRRTHLRILGLVEEGHGAEGRIPVGVPYKHF